MSIDIKPHAYDPATNPELFEGVLARRVVAFIVDVHRGAQGVLVGVGGEQFQEFARFVAEVFLRSGLEVFRG